MTPTELLQNTLEFETPPIRIINHYHAGGKKFHLVFEFESESFISNRCVPWLRWVPAALICVAGGSGSGTTWALLCRLLLVWLLWVRLFERLDLWVAASCYPTKNKSTGVVKRNDGKTIVDGDDNSVNVMVMAWFMVMEMVTADDTR